MAKIERPIGQILVRSLTQKYKGDIDTARANVEVYLTSPVGIGEHPDLVSAIDSQLQIIAEAKDKLEEAERIEAKYEGRITSG